MIALTLFGPWKLFGKRTRCSASACMHRLGFGWNITFEVLDFLYRETEDLYTRDILLRERLILINDAGYSK